LKISSNSGSLTFLKDHLGSTIGLSNGSGSLIESQKYEAFGKSNLSNSVTRYGYTGREKDDSTGLMYYRARWYDADQGRFISSDPIRFQAGENFYSYVKNNPIKFSDPTGLKEDCESDNSDSCNKDRLEMWSAMYNLTQSWNRESKRHPIYQYNGVSGTVGIIANAVGSLVGGLVNYAIPNANVDWSNNSRVYLACTEQAQGLMDLLFNLRKEGKFKNWWTFRLEFLHQTPIGALHTRVKVISVDSNCKNFWIDPWKSSIEGFRFDEDKK
jgi:RHS repeat-associated protein